MTGPARFVVGTGRCGSTLLSLMLAEHSDVVSIHEFFTGLDWGRRFAPGLVSGAELADVIGAEQSVTTQVLARGYTSDEIAYPFGSPNATYVRGDPVPWLLVTMLSRLTDDPDPLFDELMAMARSRPDATMADHYRAVFAWTAAQVSSSASPIWVERSGASIEYTADLLTLFPDARIVHLHRDGHEAALSIRNHRFFRLGVAVFFDLFPKDPTLTEDKLIDHVIETPPPLDAVGRFWSDQVVRGHEALMAMDPDRYLEVRFEDVLAHPAATMRAISTFFDLPADDAFVDRAAGLVGAPPRLRFPELTPGEQAELAAACLPGMQLLGRAG